MFDIFQAENYIMFHTLEMIVWYIISLLIMCYMHDLFWLVLNE